MMAFIWVPVVILTALLQAGLTSLSFADGAPFICLLLVAWLAYKFGDLLALPLMIIAGVILSFFVLEPGLLILAYVSSGLIITFGVRLTAMDQGLSFWSSSVVIVGASVTLVFLSNLSAITFNQSLSFLYMMAFCALINILVWRLMVLVAEPV